MSEHNAEGNEVGRSDVSACKQGIIRMEAFGVLFVPTVFSPRLFVDSALVEDSFVLGPTPTGGWFYTPQLVSPTRRYLLPDLAVVDCDRTSLRYPAMSWLPYATP